MRIGKLPQILILSLQRINQYFNTKNESYIGFDEMLDMKNYIDNELENNSLTKYKLFALTNHIGNLNTGHYYSYLKLIMNGIILLIQKQLKIILIMIQMKFIHYFILNLVHKKNKISIIQNKLNINKKM